MRPAFIPFALCIACGGDGPLPTARIDLSPDMLCEGDSGQTVVVSASRSTAPDGSDNGLSYAWVFSSPPTETIRGDHDQVELAVRFTARNPVGVRLTVKDDNGRIGTREKILAISLEALAPCSAGCTVHEICTPVAGELLCVDDSMCGGDDECGCLRCLLDDAGAPRCLP